MIGPDIEVTFVLYILILMGLTYHSRVSTLISHVGDLAGLLNRRVFMWSFLVIRKDYRVRNVFLTCHCKRYSEIKKIVGWPFPKENKTTTLYVTDPNDTHGIPMVVLRGLQLNKVNNENLRCLFWNSFKLYHMMRFILIYLIPECI